eukprot:CAMPEP_0178376616 /NCGR_PEP_ID=MMETSP0689_2-20121128/3494_1 /TAXON_ID=160604 /ORGANISM="Amphidinium massartii, Strain CS-259" /LENGTH=189 /DNA_ID=CAMNT_0019996643 /DNA_START=110 /DNA_END=676 /DNA_ORIENTATION=-
MCGAAASFVGGKRWHGKRVRGNDIFQDGQLRKLLREWEKGAEQFTGLMLMAAGKEQEDSYDQEADYWTRVEKIVGECGLVLKTTSKGWLSLWVTERGFEWQHVESYRMQKSSSMKVVASCSGRLPVADLSQHLDAQKHLTYVHEADFCKKTDATHGDVEVKTYQDFAKSLFTSLSGDPCEGEVDCDDLN